MAKRDYIYIRAWGRLMHSMPYYVHEQMEDARRDNAPANAIYSETDESGKRTWRTADDITSNTTSVLLGQIVDSMKAGV